MEQLKTANSQHLNESRTNRVTFKFLKTTHRNQDRACMSRRNTIS